MDYRLTTVGDRSPDLMPLRPGPNQKLVSKCNHMRWQQEDGWIDICSTCRKGFLENEEIARVDFRLVPKDAEEVDKYLVSAFAFYCSICKKDWLEDGVVS